MDEEIIEMHATLANQKKEMDLLQERFKRINIVNDQVTGWARKVYHKFGTLVENAAFEKNADDIVKVFEGMSVVVLEQLNQLHQQDDRGVDQDYGEAFQDFATDDFISKNIRVRPISGVTQKDETKDGRASNISKGVAGSEGNEEGEEHNHKLAVLEMEDQRKAIKMKQREIAAEAARKKAAEEKAAEAKKNAK
mmetsp:Transcript_6922/g.5175  ORF Transcript_6922/g.5175 Transcript_6922/m.5175 type:complete len:194 (+) Transcript_6922:708-1289(+)